MSMMPFSSNLEFSVSDIETNWYEPIVSAAACHYTDLYLALYNSDEGVLTPHIALTSKDEVNLCNCLYCEVNKLHNSIAKLIDRVPLTRELTRKLQYAIFMITMLHTVDDKDLDLENRLKLLVTSMKHIQRLEVYGTILENIDASYPLE